MKVTKNYIKRLVKESIDEYREPDFVHQVTFDMIEDAVRHRAEYIVSKKFALEIIEKHYLSPEELFSELGEHDSYKVSELFGWLGY